MTGWESNPLVLLRAAGASLADPQWVNMGNPTHEPRSYHAQPTFVLRLRDRRHRAFFALVRKTTYTACRHFISFLYVH